MERVRQPTFFERKIGKGEEQVLEDEEAKQLMTMLNFWHKLKMERQINKETEEKELNDKIMSFAERKVKKTTTKHHEEQGRSHSERPVRTSVIKSIAKRGQ